jgi:hypothetical protein
MTKSMGHFRDSRALSWLSGPRTDAPDEPPLKGPTLYHTRFCKSSSLSMPAASATAKMSFSVLRRLKTCVSSAMKNDRLSSLGLMHIHRDFEVDLYKAMEVFVSAKHEGQNLTILRYSCLSVIKIVLDSMLYETLKWPQIAPFCISSNIIMACTLLSLIYPLIEAFN